MVFYGFSTVFYGLSYGFLYGVASYLPTTLSLISCARALAKPPTATMSLTTTLKTLRMRMKPRDCVKA